ncbi:12489_t:CDS:1 [Dentiscutata erythropus]|uniref:12489_t:CDS:1 n=1 Tax=Dentiscutata erythropus TaxID=1348616 RepID=A0A9N9J7H1_9GLOM|nr:12489_t:CDS:1 [Dentiscutata erythropus]
MLTDNILPIPLEEIFANAKAIQKDYLFKINPLASTNKMLLEYKTNFYNLLTYSETEFDIDKVYKELVKNVEPGCQVDGPKVIILEPGSNPCSDKAIQNTCNIFFDNVGKKTNRHSKIDIVAIKLFFNI